MLQRAYTIAEEVLFPRALDVDAGGVIPGSHFDLLAEQGFYGLAGQAENTSLNGIFETLAGGCLTTTFTWIQHHGLVRALAGTTNVELREKYLDAAVRGTLRGGVAYAGAIPRPPRLWATATAGGWLISGDAPFVTGWGIIDMLLVSARDLAGGPQGAIVSGLVSAEAGGGITVEELHLVAAAASNTVRLRFEDHFLPAEKVTAEVLHSDFLARTHIALRSNGSLAMGVAGRCIRMIGEAGRPELAELLEVERDTIRDRLDRGLSEPATLLTARAAASALAYRCAGALMVATGSSGLLADRHAQRLVREAAFTLVAAGRPGIKESLLDLFGSAR
ncbi:MAG TPA: acyl-CoA dehydrogenase family protein [Pseudonocardiaceae bacterium]|jgi:alkylation response protein AidB-like acyl-CoA dehydrogenase|nr:acyl-CoA dehydrogenase family protein [Pseudonocardiaceae bacterium]